jgi:hypothetical protein
LWKGDDDVLISTMSCPIYIALAWEKSHSRVTTLQTVREICLSPAGRSTPLQKLPCHTHIIVGCVISVFFQGCQQISYQIHYSRRIIIHVYFCILSIKAVLLKSAIQAYSMIADKSVTKRRKTARQGTYLHGYNP